VKRSEFTAALAIRCLVAAATTLFVSICGCPDFSHQAPVPDYSNMTDEGEPADSD
jgi:hypothetical protein